MSDIRLAREVVSSPANKGIKRIRSLLRRKGRQQERAFVVEGVRAVNDVIGAGILPRAIYVREDFPLEDVPPAATPVHRVTPGLFDTLTDLPSPQGILAIVPMLKEPGLPAASAEQAPLILIVDGVRDPGNLGTLLRSAAGAGADHFIIGPGSVDPYHPRAIRAAMGAYVRVPFSRRSWQELEPILDGYPLVALADADGDATYDEVDWTGPVAMIVGGEAFGASAELRAVANHHVSIPLANGIESLNAGVAGSLLLFEAVRQRRAAGSASGPGSA